jgi:hypothetical protein
VVLIDSDQGVLFVERRFGPRGEPLGVTERRFALETGDSRLETGD